MSTPLFRLSAEAVAAWAQVATLIIAAVATIFAFLQVQASKRISRESEAQESFRDYIRLLIENPGINDRSDQNQSQYHYLVVFMLTTFEKIFELSRADACWLTAMETHILWHKEYLIELDRDNPKFFPSFERDFCRFVLTTIGEVAVKR